TAAVNLDFVDSNDSIVGLAARRVYRDARLRTLGHADHRAAKPALVSPSPDSNHAPIPPSGAATSTCSAATAPCPVLHRPCRVRQRARIRNHRRWRSRVGGTAAQTSAKWPIRDDENITREVAV